MQGWQATPPTWRAASSRVARKGDEQHAGREQAQLSDEEGPGHQGRPLPDLLPRGRGGGGNRRVALPSSTFNAAGERVGRMGAGEAIKEPVLMESSE